MAEWTAGRVCVIHGLQSAAGQRLNGRIAEVRGSDEATGRLQLSLHPEDPPANWKLVKPENVRAAPTAASGAECRFCLELADDESLVSPCPCRGSAGGVHLQCLQQAYMAGDTSTYPACPTCKRWYDGRTAVMLLEPVCAELEQGQTGGAVYAQALGHLGTAHGESGEPSMAVRALQRALVIQEREFGPEHREVAVTKFNLAWAWREGDAGRSLELMKAAHCIFARAFGSEHPRTKEAARLRDAWVSTLLPGR